MDHASTINFLSNEDTQELAPGFFIGIALNAAFCPPLRMAF
jgi:hypothetical protein